ncbi:hypothetical protein FB45DRAFT_1007672 [Roridomyces roridus]|uniref:Uncharacterized protein n=1 Tax=Roridomyces roridus TaxID=1738132 RepID=A0AAD7BDK3_9AGAR|nr:hypothetical protein FB45DRAFT_1007672 [Roridomyces roridus]
MAADAGSDTAPPAAPPLPLDLERAILEISAWSSPREIPILMLVAHRVKVWVEPLLYRVVFLSDYDPKLECIPVFTYAVFLHLLATKPAGFLQKAVKHLYLGERDMDDSPETHDEDLRSILQTCTDVTDFFDFQGTHLELVQSLKCVRRIAVNCRHLYHVPSHTNFSHPMFRNLTHLEVLDETNDADLAGIPHIPHLSHFAFNLLGMCPSVFSSVVPACPRLACIVLLQRADDMDHRLKPFLDDERFVLIHQSDFTFDWQRAATGGVNYWDVADAFIRARRAGRVGRITSFISDEDVSWF